MIKPVQYASASRAEDYQFKLTKSPETDTETHFIRGVYPDKGNRANLKAPSLEVLVGLSLPVRGMFTFDWTPVYVYVDAGDIAAVLSQNSETESDQQESTKWEEYSRDLQEASVWGDDEHDNYIKFSVGNSGELYLR